MNACDAVIVGAGPYGLSAAAHLRTIKGMEIRVFGDAMSFWSRNMPAGMFLRSNWAATQIACPNGHLTLNAFQAERGSRSGTPVPLEFFIQYGMWYQGLTVPDLDQRQVFFIERGHKGFRLTLQDGEIVETRRVIIAGGIGPFARRPPEFQRLPPALVTHTVDHHDFGELSAKRVLVLGSGQSALESSALLHEAGAEVEVLARSRTIHWLQGWASKTLHQRMGKAASRILYAPTDVGPAGISQILARPEFLRALPRQLQNTLRRRATRPAGSRWLVERLRNVPITLSCSVISATPSGDRVRVRLSDGGERIVDHVLLGTGFHVDITKYEFLSPDLLRRIHRANGYPILSDGLETSIPGMHVLGAPAAYSFGPLLQFVSGTRYASCSLMRSLAKGSSSVDSGEKRP